MPIPLDELDWSSPQASRYRVPLVWRRLPDGGYIANTHGENWRLQLGDFPTDPMWTLLVNMREVARFTEWPPEWKKEEQSHVGSPAKAGRAASKNALRLPVVVWVVLAVAVAGTIWVAARIAANAGIEVRLPFLV
jgi:hypothetical protein